mgnify:CR=1 FL=1
MKTPKHWNHKGCAAYMLWPLGLLYGTATLLRQTIKKPRKVSAKVICIGNLTAGGTGKTPVSVSIAALLQQHAKKVCFLTRGYGGKSQNIMVEAHHQATEVGDEPLILARQAPVMVNKNRAEGAKQIIKTEAEYIIMDDGFQNPSLHKDASLLVIDGEAGFGNGFCIPAGPLREFQNQGLKRAQGIILLGDDKHNLCANIKHIPIFKGKVVPQSPQTTDQNVVAFAGIGRPEKFYNSLKSCNMNVVKTFDFPDHYFYQKNDIEKLLAAAKEHNAVLYTTAKDIVKIPTELRTSFNVLEIAIEWENQQALSDFLLSL